ncbi:hypothetical protein DL93DRAFT_2092278, partial [Clavulina sp. PMI_390]
MSKENLTKLAATIGLPKFFSVKDLGAYLAAQGMDQDTIGYCLKHTPTYTLPSRPKTTAVDNLRLAQFVFLLHCDAENRPFDRPITWHPNSIQRKRVFSWERDESTISRLEREALKLWVCIPQERSSAPHLEYGMRPYDRCYIPVGGMILRNLSKKEYVRSKTLGVDDDAWGFGKVLLCRTLWSSSRSTSMVWSQEYDREWHRGVWAGDAFDIVSEAELIGVIPQWTMEPSFEQSQASNSLGMEEGTRASQSTPKIDADAPLAGPTADNTTESSEDDGEDEEEDYKVEIEQHLQGWRDVSSEVRAQLIAIWRSEGDEDGTILRLIDL